MAPPGKHAVHAYVAANEPYGLWEGMDRRSEEYKALKKERAEVLYRALENVIPDIRQRVELELIGTPLTHERFTRRCAAFARITETILLQHCPCTHDAVLSQTRLAGARTSFGVGGEGATEDAAGGRG